MAKDRESFVHRFEGPEVLDDLLALAGSPFSTDAVVTKMREAQGQKLETKDFIPTLFEAEPRFENPAVARQLFQNLLGLWDIIQSGKPLAPKKEERPERVKRVRAIAPSPFGTKAPTEEFVNAAAEFLHTDPKGWERLLHSFENRQDELLTHLDDQLLSDGSYLVVRGIVAELHAMLELGWGEGPRAVNPAWLSGQDELLPEVAPLKAYADKAILRAEQRAESPLPSEEASAARDLVSRALGALWMARPKGR